jgi:hypothetical protein
VFALNDLYVDEMPTVYGIVSTFCQSRESGGRSPASAFGIQGNKKSK